MSVGHYLFGPFRLDIQARELLVRGVKLRIRDKAFDVLSALVRRRGDLATKDQLLIEVWPGQFVEENNLPTQILDIRKLLRRHGDEDEYIATVARKGYRFAVAVTLAPSQEAHSNLRPGPGHNLPEARTSFIGRTAELAAISAQMHDSQLLTLVGAGGIGKTRCALSAAQALLPNFPDGVWVVELSPLRDGALVAEAVCRVVGAPVSADRSPQEAATGFLRHSRLLLLLDNCEHVLPACAAMAAALLRECAGVRILATSRQPLGIAGEMLFGLEPMDVPRANGGLDAETARQSDAVALFVSRAGSAAGFYDFPDRDAAHVATICRRLDGLPMAVELAAARMRVMQPAEIVTGLEEMFRFLTTGSDLAEPRQRTLWAVIDWSHDLLLPAEQALLRRLSVYVDGFCMASASAVAGDAVADQFEVLDLLTALASKSLIGVERRAPTTRFRMLETTRHYAAERLKRSGEHGVFRKAATYLAAFFTEAERTWPVTPTEAWLAAFGTEVENLRTAIDWAFGQAHGGEQAAREVDPELGIELVARAGCIADEMSLHADLARWTAAALAQVSPQTPPVFTAWNLYWATRHTAIFGVGEVSAARRRMIALFRQADDTVGLSCALRTTGMAIARRDEPEGEARAMLLEAVELLRPLGASKHLATALAHLGSFHYFMGDDERAQAYSEEALDMRRRLGDRTGVSISFMNMGEYAFVRGDTARAIGYATEAVSQARQLALKETLATALSNLSNYLLSQDRLEAAREAACESVRLFRALGHDDHAVLCLENLTLARVLSGDARLAALLFGYTDAHFRNTTQQREPSETIRFRRLADALSQALGPDRLAELMAEGALWTADMADAAAFRPDGGGTGG